MLHVLEMTDMLFRTSDHIGPVPIGNQRERLRSCTWQVCVSGGLKARGGAFNAVPNSVKP